MHKAYYEKGNKLTYLCEQFQCKQHSHEGIFWLPNYYDMKHQNEVFLVKNHFTRHTLRQTRKIN